MGRLIGSDGLRRAGRVAGVSVTAALLCMFLMTGCIKIGGSQSSVSPPTFSVSTIPANDAATPSPPSEDQPLSFAQVVPKCKRVPRVNADDCLVFRYMMYDPAGDETLNVELPASWATGARPRCAWESRFACYGKTVSRAAMGSRRPERIAGLPVSMAQPESAPSQPRIILYTSPT